MTKDEIKDEIIKKQDQLIDYLKSQWKDNLDRLNYTYESERLTYSIESLKHRLASLKAELEKEKDKSINQDSNKY